MSDSKKHDLAMVLSTWFTALLLITNVLNTKSFQLGPFDFPVGIILFPATFLGADFVTEILGWRESRRIIWTGFGALLVLVVTVEIGRVLPPPAWWKHQEAYVALLHPLWRISLASLVAYLCGEFTNSVVLAKMKVRTHAHHARTATRRFDKGMASRFLLSTVAGQAVDSVIFMTVAFAGVYPTGSLLSLILSAWAFKVLWEAIALPVSVPLATWLKARADSDALDVGVDFNPLRLG